MTKQISSYVSNQVSICQNKTDSGFLLALLLFIKYTFINLKNKKWVVAESIDLPEVPELLSPGREAVQAARAPGMLPEGMSEQLGSVGGFGGHLCLVAPHRVPVVELILLCKVFLCKIFSSACFFSKD